MENQNKNQIYILIFKLLHDTLALILIAFAGLLISDAILPGFISSHVSFLEMTLLVLANLCGLIYLRKKIDCIPEKTASEKSAFVVALIILSALIMAASLLKFSIAANVIITISSLFIFFFFYKSFFTAEK